MVKKLIVGAAVIGIGVTAIRRSAPALEQKMMAKCEGMFDRMPENSPPKRMLHGIDEIRDQNERILQHLEQPTTLAVAQ